MRIKAITGPVLTTGRSATVGEVRLGVGILRAQVADRHANAGEGEQEVYPPFSTELGRLAGGELAELERRLDERAARRSHREILARFIEAGE